MFVRTIQRKSSHRNVAVQIVESYRNDKGQPRQRILRHMGTAPEGEALEQLKRIAHSEMEKMLKYKPLPLLPMTTEASILAADPPMMTIGPFLSAMRELWWASSYGS